MRLCNVLRPNGGCKAVLRIIGQLNGFFFVSEALQGNDRSENLLLIDLTFRPKALDDSGLDKKPISAPLIGSLGSISTAEDCPSGLLRAFYV